jgi:hypothetical protein
MLPVKPGTCEANKGWKSSIDGRVLSQSLLDVSVASNSNGVCLMYYTKSSVDEGAPVANQLVGYIFINRPTPGFENKIVEANDVCKEQNASDACKKLADLSD